MGLGMDSSRQLTSSSNWQTLTLNLCSYSTVVNNFLNVQNYVVNDSSLSPGQIRISNDTYNEIVKAQLTDLWSNYGTLTEVCKTCFVSQPFSFVDFWLKY